jgi:hypothetical protein
VILLILNAVLGLILFELAWKKTLRYRDPIPELEMAIPAYRRNDAPKWRKWRFYLGAMTVLLPRILISCTFAVIGSLLLKIILLG